MLTSLNSFKRNKHLTSCTCTILEILLALKRCNHYSWFRGEVSGTLKRPTKLHKCVKNKTTGLVIKVRLLDATHDSQLLYKTFSNKANHHHNSYMLNK